MRGERTGLGLEATFYGTIVVEGIASRSVSRRTGETMGTDMKRGLKPTGCYVSSCARLARIAKRLRLDDFPREVARGAASIEGATLAARDVQLRDAPAVRAVASAGGGGVDVHSTAA